MKIFLDTANLESIRKFNDMGLLDGITTNPSLMSKEGGNPKDAMAEITKIIKGDVSLEVVSTDYSGMMEEGKRLRQYGENVVVKVPMTPDGLKACKSLSSEGIPVNVTLIFSANQALLAAKSGAKYVSPFIGRLDDIGQDGMELIKEIKKIFENYPQTIKTQILVASVRHPLHVIDAAKVGADVATLPPGVLDKMMLHPLTTIGLENFLKDWEKLKAGNSDIKI
ncbi:fructose-6-phosphate aldolase [Nitrosopumilus sp.]|uniref:fructose-6-phosphate aldolase n=1 Tax=Nitrosopumilus sp. TaxID=2024843 RepID=UPI00247F104C|nr:fructose-6-phosphate aldolase [Nitrosopumilus sp.]MCV0430584.1 fructose-6-phosphate aldolase [Nitrosopumilus sp.]